MAKKRKTKRVSRSYYYKQTGGDTGGGNTGLIVGLIVVGALGGIGYWLYKQGKLPFGKPAIDPKNVDTPAPSPNTTTTTTTTPTNTTTTPTNTTTGGGGLIETIFGGDGSNEPTPFSSNIEGNLFRVWINDNYNTYAREIDLDRSGAYDNSFIRKAWKKYGEQYANSGQVDNSSPLGVSIDADNLFEAMNRWGTDEDVLIAISNQPNAKQVREYYDSNLGKFENRTLRDWIMDETTEGLFGYGGDKAPDGSGDNLEDYLIARFY
jgi:hypothetical protein